jgi:hypothetical protein
MSKKMEMLVLFATVAFLSSAHARLGETGPQIVQRYGQPVKNLGQESDDIHRFMFEKDNISIRVTIKGNDSVEEIYRTVDNSELSQPAINELLKANDGKSSWNQVRSSDQEIDWERADEQAYAKSTKPGNILTVVTKKYAETLQHQGEQPADSGGVNGF